MTTMIWDATVCTKDSQAWGELKMNDLNDYKEAIEFKTNIVTMQPSQGTLSTPQLTHQRQQ